MSVNVNKVFKTEAFELTVNCILGNYMKLLRTTAFELLIINYCSYTCYTYNYYNYLLIIYYKSFCEEYFLVYLENYIKLQQMAVF